MKNEQVDKLIDEMLSETEKYVPASNLNRLSGANFIAEGFQYTLKGEPKRFRVLRCTHNEKLRFGIRPKQRTHNIDLVGNEIQYEGKDSMWKCIVYGSPQAALKDFTKLVGKKNVRQLISKK